MSETISLTLLTIFIIICVVLVFNTAHNTKNRTFVLIGLVLTGFIFGIITHRIYASRKKPIPDDGGDKDKDKKTDYLQCQQYDPDLKLEKNEIYMEFCAQEFNPYDKNKWITHINWVLQQSANMVDGDVAVFGGDYLVFASGMSCRSYQPTPQVSNCSLLDNLRSAMARGAKVILLIERFMVCGPPFDPSKGGQNMCYVTGRCGLAGEGGKCENGKCVNHGAPRRPDGTCFDDGKCNTTHFCDVTNQLLKEIGYTKENKNLIVIDVPTPELHPDPPRTWWGHNHRKVVSFYSNSRKTAGNYRGSSNLTTDPKLSIRETGWGLISNLDSDFAQTCLQTDIDTIEPTMFFTEGDDAPLKLPYPPAEDPVKVLQSFKRKGLKGYPKQPIEKVTLYWTAPDALSPTYGSEGEQWVSGIDRDVSIVCGLNPPGNDQGIKFNFPESFQQGWKDLYDRTNIVKWQDKMYNVEDGKVSVVPLDSKNSTYREMPWAKGSVWGGTLLSMFFERAIKNSSKFVNIALFQFLLSEVGPVCPDNQGCSYPWTQCGPCPIGVDDGPWYMHLQGPIPTYIMKYLKENKTGQLNFLHGKQKQDDFEKELNQYPVLSEISGMGDEVTERVTVSNYSGDTSCNEECASGYKCCKDHTKMWFSDRDVVLSSGHPTRSYYSDMNGINDDILFMDAPTLVNFYCNQWNALTNQGMIIPYQGKKNFRWLMDKPVPEAVCAYDTKLAKNSSSDKYGSCYNKNMKIFENRQCV